MAESTRLAAVHSSLTGDRASADAPGDVMTQIRLLIVALAVACDVSGLPDGPNDPLDGTSDTAEPDGTDPDSDTTGVDDDTDDDTEPTPVVSV